MKKFFVVFLCLVGFSACHHKVYSLDDLPKQFIEIGSFGGFAGSAQSYFFMPNGQRFMNSGILSLENTNGAIELKKAEPKEFKAMLKGLKKMDFDKLDLKEIGNMTHYIRLKTKKKDKKIQWSNMDTAPKKLVDFYREYIKNINQEAIN